ncbi:hypothetical protein ACLOJK_015274 [Asimina triloba]
MESGLASVAVKCEKSAEPENDIQDSLEATYKTRLTTSPRWSTSFYSDACDSGTVMGFHSTNGSVQNLSKLNETYPGLPFDHGKLYSPSQIDARSSLGSGPSDFTYNCVTHPYPECGSDSRGSNGKFINGMTYNRARDQPSENEVIKWDIISQKTIGKVNDIVDYAGSSDFMHLDVKKDERFLHRGDEYTFEMEACEPVHGDCATLIPDHTQGKEILGDILALGSQQLNHNTSCIGVSTINTDPSVPSLCHEDLDVGQFGEIMPETWPQHTIPSLCRGLSATCPDVPFANVLVESFLPHAYLQPFVPGPGQKMTCIKDEKQDELLRSIKLEAQGGSLRISPSDILRNMNGPTQERNHNKLNGEKNTLLKCETSGMKNAVGMKTESKGQLLGSQSACNILSKGIDDAVQKNCSGESCHDDDDADVCILEEISDPRYLVHNKPYSFSQRSMLSNPLHHLTGGTRYKANDERLTFQVALQNLSHTSSEASPPDGVLAVPLLKHQRIALSWMVQKETNSLHCSGGILADDQGLGKTVSTIALILSERSPSSKFSSMSVNRGEFEALNLDDDDDGVLELNEVKHGRNPNLETTKRRQTKDDKMLMATKGRPAAGTLVVCPTSVLRQWAEELHNKVTSNANLTVLVYHGSNRTKDPNELAKYDVVLTTYSIVSMEVPKQPLADEDDEERGKPGDHGMPMGPSTGRKRKYPPSSSNKKNLKNKRGIDGALLESVARPLARVGWFRVILDEAQSIKNHRTQVARACWGLRAKRRWCLSGTPIQNAIDDLYSYFRFLRYDPYAGYKTFCSNIKVPINKNPTNGYKKLQAVLKTIMLRRTKGTLLDGEPIINLPPKSVTLKKVDFSVDEREFYSRLEADSRAQFKVYSDAGTIKQNYVNILLMLLRLRQACDHPLLVKGYDSDSMWKSSVDTAKKLPKEKQMLLLSCLEACLAICSICNVRGYSLILDPPEDAVVTICGHVFCNQCICEHLTGDDNLCPMTHCKVHLCVNSVFSKATLRSSLSDGPSHDFSIDNSVSDLVRMPELCARSPSDSSKIHAALEILLSLSKSQDCSLQSGAGKTIGDGLVHQESSPVDLRHGGCKDICEDIHSDVERSPSMPVAEKAIVFSQWTRMLDLLEVPLKISSIHYRRLDGTMSVAARDKAVKDFNTLPEVSVMIMSLKAASLGLNMVAACHVILLDLWWNPTTEDQAIDRAHRIGQTRPVTVSRLTVKDTVEDRILALQEKKREMVASAFGEDETGSRQTRLTVEDLEYLEGIKGGGDSLTNKALGGNLKTILVSWRFCE